MKTYLRKIDNILKKVSLVIILLSILIALILYYLANHEQWVTSSVFVDHEEPIKLECVIEALDSIKEINRLDIEKTYANGDSSASYTISFSCHQCSELITKKIYLSYFTSKLTQLTLHSPDSDLDYYYKQLSPKTYKVEIAVTQKIKRKLIERCNLPLKAFINN